MGSIYVDKIELLTVRNTDGIIFFCILCGGKFKNFRNVFMLKSAVRVKKFYSVSVERKVACGNHHRAVKMSLLKNN